RRIVRGCDDDAVGAVQFEVAIASEDGMREDGCRRVAELLIGHDLDVVGREDFDRGSEGGLRQGVRVSGEEERAEGVLGGAVLDDGLSDGGDVVVVEGGGEGAPTMSGGSEGYAL